MSAVFVFNASPRSAYRESPMKLSVVFEKALKVLKKTQIRVNKVLTNETELCEHCIFL